MAEGMTNWQSANLAENLCHSGSLTLPEWHTILINSNRYFYKKIMFDEATIEIEISTSKFFIRLTLDHSNS